MKKDIRNLVNFYVKKFDTRNPYELAKCLNVEVQVGQLGSRAGCYMFLKNHKCIFLMKIWKKRKCCLSWLTNWVMQSCIGKRIVILFGIKRSCSLQGLRLKQILLQQSYLYRMILSLSILGCLQNRLQGWQAIMKKLWILKSCNSLI